MERQESMIERRLRQNVATVEQQAARIAELEDALKAAIEVIANYARRDAASLRLPPKVQQEHVKDATAHFDAVLGDGAKEAR